MLDHTVAVTGADRGLLLEPDSSGLLRVRLARRSGGKHRASESLVPSQTVLRLAVDKQSSIVTQDLKEADLNLQAAESIVLQQLRSVIAIPLYTMPRASSAESAITLKRGDFLGIMYLDSRRPAAFSQLDRQILDALAIGAASILENARLVERERERQRLEQELSIAREIQQALLPRGFRDFPNLAVTGIHSPCLAVGGDYFDVFPLGDGRTAFLVADVSGKGLGAALLTTMLQGALSGMTIGADPARVFNHINNFICEHSEVGRYATVFFGIIDDLGHVEFINAGHPSPLLLRRGEVVEPFTEGSFPVGLIPGSHYVAACIELQPEDTLVLFSDGVTEAMDRRAYALGCSRKNEIGTVCFAASCCMRCRAAISPSTHSIQTAFLSGYCPRKISNADRRFVMKAGFSIVLSSSFVTLRRSKSATFPRRDLVSNNVSTSFSDAAGRLARPPPAHLGSAAMREIPAHDLSRAAVDHADRP